MRLAQVLSNRILVKRVESPGVSSSLIIVPENARPKSLRGKVVMIGEGKKNRKGERIPIEGVSVGDIVVFGRYSGAEIPHVFKMDDEEMLVLHEDEVLAVLET